MQYIVYPYPCHAIDMELEWKRIFTRLVSKSLHLAIDGQCMTLAIRQKHSANN